MNDSKRWFIYRTGAVGDTVLLSPIVQKIKQHDPHAWVELWGHQEKMNLLVGDGLADKAFSSEQMGIETLYGEGEIDQKLKTYLADFDYIVFYIRTDSDTLQKRLRSHDQQHIVIAKPLPDANYTKHITTFYLDEIGTFFDDDILFNPRINIPTKEITKASHYLLSQGIDKEIDFVLAVHVGAGSEKKMAALDYFYSAIQFYAKRFRLHVLLIEGPADKKRNETFIEKFPYDTRISIVKEVSLAYLGAILKQSDFFIGNDSGVAHLAAAVECPSLVFFISTNPTVWRPLGRSIQIKEIDKNKFL